MTQTKDKARPGGRSPKASPESSEAAAKAQARNAPVVRPAGAQGAVRRPLDRRLGWDRTWLNVRGPARLDVVLDAAEFDLLASEDLFLTVFEKLVLRPASPARHQARMGVVN